MNKEKLTNIFFKNKNMKPLYIILIIGVVLLLLSNVFSGGTQKKASDSEASSIAMPTRELKDELEDILSEIKGAGKVKVMITYEGTGEKHLAADVTSEQNKSENGSESAGGRTQTNIKQTSKLFSPNNAPVITKESFPKVMGVIVVCDGGEQTQVKADITNAVRSLLDVAEHKISVFAKK